MQHEIPKILYYNVFNEDNVWKLIITKRITITSTDVFEYVYDDAPTNLEILLKLTEFINESEWIYNDGMYYYPEIPTKRHQRNPINPHLSLTKENFKRLYREQKLKRINRDDS